MSLITRDHALRLRKETLGRGFVKFEDWTLQDILDTLDKLWKVAESAEMLAKDSRNYGPMTDALAALREEK